MRPIDPATSAFSPSAGIAGKTQIIFRRKPRESPAVVQLKHDDPYRIVILSDQNKREKNWPEFSDSNINIAKFRSIWDDFERILKRIKPFGSTHDADILAEAVNMFLDEMEGLTTGI